MKCVNQSPFLTIVRMVLWFLQLWCPWGNLLSCLPFGGMGSTSTSTFQQKSLTGNFKGSPITILLHIWYNITQTGQNQHWQKSWVPPLFSPPCPWSGGDCMPMHLGFLPNPGTGQCPPSLPLPLKPAFSSTMFNTISDPRTPMLIILILPDPVKSPSPLNMGEWPFSQPPFLSCDPIEYIITIL